MKHSNYYGVWQRERTQERKNDTATEHHHEEVGFGGN